MRRMPVLLICAVLFPMQLLARDIDLPDIKAGDAWVYKSTVEKGQNGRSQKLHEYKVIRATSNSIFLEMKEKDSSQPPKEVVVGRDWSRFRNINGQEKVVNRPLMFPLREGNKWEVDYTEANPAKDRKLEHIHTSYSVVGREVVEVPAGTFTAIKIEAEGKWEPVLEPSIKSGRSAQASPSGSSVVMQSGKTPQRNAAGRTYKAFWYVPEIKRFVKSVEEYYSAGGVRSERFTEELDSFQPAR